VLRSVFRLCGAVLLLAGGVRAASAQVGFLAFGDSITRGVGDDPTRTDTGYPPRLQSLLVNAGVQATVKNVGNPGEDTQGGLTRIDSELALIPTSTEVLLLMEGSNDISRGISFETTMFDLREMARKAELKGLAVVHATTIPRIPTAWVDDRNLVNLRLAENLRDLAGTRNRDLADPFEVFSNLPNLFATYYAVPTAEVPDPVGHPNAAGYDRLAQIFFDVIRDRDTVAPVPGITTPLHGAEGVSATAPITVDVWDFGTGIDLAATRLLVNGTDVGVAATGTPKHAQLSFTPATPLTGAVRVGLRSRDLAVPTPNATDKDVARFIVAGTTILAGDLDRDGRVDGRDLVQLARRFGAHANEARYLALADFNGDGTIDGSDLAVLASNFGKTSFTSS
jgi:lysophospholipase L1-like esterase